MTMRRGMGAVVFAAAAMASGAWPARGDDPPLAIATFQVDATPPLGSPLCGGAVPPARAVVDPLSCRGVALLASGGPVVLCAVDWVGIANEGHDVWRRDLARAAGTTADRVAVQCLHQHDAPTCDFDAEALMAARGRPGRGFDPEFARATIARAADALKQAMARPRRVTHLGLGRAEVRQVASNRRGLGPDGTVQSVRWSATTDPAARAAPEGVIDPLVRVIGLWDGDRCVASLSDYATHPQSHYGQGLSLQGPQPDRDERTRRPRLLGRGGQPPWPRLRR